MPEFQWSRGQARYQYKNGRPVSDDAIASWLDKAIQAGQDRIKTLSADLSAGRVNVAEWKLGIVDEIKAAHRMAYQLAHGPNLGPSEIGRLGATMRGQYGYLDAFAAGLESGEIDLQSAFGGRAASYLDAVWNSWQNEQATGKEAAGFTEYRNVLNEGAAHCEACEGETGKGWVAIGDLSPIGSRQCVVRDRCRFEYR